jgi:hypothetical protein
MKIFTVILLTTLFGLSPLGALAQSAPLTPGIELAGTMDQTINSANAQAGDPFVISNVSSVGGSGSVTNATIYGHVADVTTAGQGRNAAVKLAFDRVQLYDGKRFSLDARPIHIDVVTKTNAPKEGLGAIAGDLLGNWVGQTIGVGLLGPIGLAGGYLLAKNARQNVTIPQNSLITLQVITAHRQAAAS